MTDKALVYVSIGSNIERYSHISASLDALADNFGELSISKVYESEAVGFEGDNFLNLVAGFNTELSVGELSALLRKIEDENGRRRDGPKFGPRTCSSWGVRGSNLTFVAKDTQCFSISKIRT